MGIAPGPIARRRLYRVAARKFATAVQFTASEIIFVAFFLHNFFFSVTFLCMNVHRIFLTLALLFFSIFVAIL